MAEKKDQKAFRWAQSLTAGCVPTDPAGLARRPKLLDLFCGGGGAGFGYYLAGFDVTGCDKTVHSEYPFPFIHASALDVPLAGYDAIHASPPCLAYTSIIPASQRDQHGHRWGHEPLIAPTRLRLEAPGVPHIIENVLGAAGELKEPIKLDGTMFGLRVFRSRLFESNMGLEVTRQSNFSGKTLGIHSPKGAQGANNTNATEMIREGHQPGVPSTGWQVEEVERQTGGSKGRIDKYYYHQETGKRFRSVVEVERFLGVRIPVPAAVPPAGEAMDDGDGDGEEEDARDTEEQQQLDPVVTSNENIWTPENREYFAVYGAPGARPGTNRGTLGQWRQAMAGPLLKSLDWLGPKPLAQSIPPAYSEYLGRQLLRRMGWTVNYPPISYTGQIDD